MNKISEETMLRYVQGTASLEEIAQVISQMKHDADFRKEILILEGLSSDDISFENSSIPMANLAAVAKDNLCDVLCEQYILKHYSHQYEIEDLVNDASANSWLQESGIPLHNMGRLLEKNGISVKRLYHATLNDIAENLAANRSMIAVIDYGKMFRHEDDACFHAVVCLRLQEDIITIFDPASESETDYRVNDFESAWSSSRNYLIIASTEQLEYDPRPIDVSDMKLDADLLELTEAIAEDTHEVWAFCRKNEGWTYGEERDDKNKKHPDMVPYARLTEGEKQYDRELAFHTIRLVKKLGYTISRPGRFRCSECGRSISRDMNFCPQCGHKIEDREIMP